MIIVRTLLGCRDFDASCICLGSLLKAWNGEVTLEIFEDGTLSEAHLERLERELAPRRVISAGERAEPMNAALSRFPRCRSFRDASILTHKLFDILLYAAAPGDTIHYCDSDIYWARPVLEAFARRDHGPQALFLQDSFSAYSLRPWDFLADSTLRAVANLNSGLISAPANILELEFLEWLLEKPVVQTRFSRTSCWAEQTCWALLAARSGASLLSRDVVRVVGRTTLTDNLESIDAFHVVSSCRGALPELVRRVRALPRSALIERSSAEVLVPAERLGAIAHATSELRFRLGL